VSDAETFARGDVSEVAIELALGQNPLEVDDTVQAVHFAQGCEDRSDFIILGNVTGEAKIGNCPAAKPSTRPLAFRSGR
jgi:hypothetical protein